MADRVQVARNDHARTLSPHQPTRNSVDVVTRPQAAVIREKHSRNSTSPRIESRISSPDDQAARRGSSLIEPPHGYPSSRAGHSHRRHQHAGSSVSHNDSTWLKEKDVETIHRVPTADALPPAVYGDAQAKRSSRSSTQQPRSVEHSIQTYSETDPECERLEDEATSARRIMRGILYICLVTPLLSIFNALYTSLALVWITLDTPLKLCMSGPSFRTQAIRFLLFPFNLQRHCVSLPPILRTSDLSFGGIASKEYGATSVTPDTSARTIYGADGRPISVDGRALIVTHLVSPLLSIPLVLVAWGTVLAWGLSAMINHERSGGVSDQERNFAATLVGMWSRWLDWCVGEVVIVENRRERERGRRRSRRSNEAV